MNRPPLPTRLDTSAVAPAVPAPVVTSALDPAAGRPFALAFVVAPFVALALALAMPVTCAVVAVALFGVAHLGLETGYVVGRFSPRFDPRWLWVLLIPLTAIALLRLAAIGPTGTRIELLIALGMVFGAWAWFTRTHLPTLLVGGAVVVALTIAALRRPDLYLVVAAQAHNLVPLAFLWEWSAARGTPAGRLLFRGTLIAWFVVVPLVVFSGAFDGMIDGWGLLTWSGDRTAEQVAAPFGPAGWSGAWPVRFLVVFAFGQLLHYVVWCGFFPAVAREEHAATGRRLVRAGLPKQWLVLVAAGAIATIGVLHLVAGPVGRRLYATFASYHAYLEYPVLVVLAAQLALRPWRKSHA